MKPKHQRMCFIGLSLAIGAIAVWLILKTLNNKIVFFYTPSEITQALKSSNREIRIGGQVEKGSLKKSPDSQSYAFVVTDGTARLFIKYRGLLPDLFREGQGIVAHGAFTEQGIFSADEILAKHDEKYIPPTSHSLSKDAANRLGRGEKMKAEGL